MITRTCTHCNQEKPLAQLKANKPSKHGRMRMCYTCHHDYENYGGKRKLVLKRDGYKCLNCGMTQKQHKEKWNKSLAIDHIDMRGIGVGLKEKNNNLDNLQTLCFRCHGAKDATKWKTPRMATNKQKVRLG